MSLRWKLVALYASIVAIVIAGFSVAIAVGMRKSLVEALDTELETRARAVGALVENEDGKWFVERKSGSGEEVPESEGMYYLVCDRAGNALASSPLARELDVRGDASPGARFREAGGRKYREVAIAVTRLPDEEWADTAHDIRVVCGKDSAPIEASQQSLIGQLWIIGPLVLLASLAGGFFLVARALRPIGRMTAAAEEINATDLSRRIEAGGKDELARLARTLNEMFGRLEASFERQAQFTADASHELRTPLTVIAGNVELALKRPRSADELCDIVRDIGDASGRMRAVVEDLLTLARHDAKTAPARREALSLTEAAGEMVRLYQPLAEAHGVALSVEASGDVRVTGDPARLKLLISNLVTNGIRYNRPGGKVVVKVSAAPGGACLAVDDTGIGIAADDLPHIFERFWRVDKARSRDAGGSGLGLAIARSIALLHSGRIEVSSTPGVGTRFTVTLPA